MRGTFYTTLREYSSDGVAWKGNPSPRNRSLSPTAAKDHFQKSQTHFLNSHASAMKQQATYQKSMDTRLAQPKYKKEKYAVTTK